MNCRQILVLVIAISCCLADSVYSQGPGFGGGRGRGRGPDERFAADREVFQFLLANHGKITRTVKQLPNGVETLTESAVPEIATKIREHVDWMQVRVEEAKPIRRRDPLFAELFEHADKIKMVAEATDRGVRVTETSDDPYVVTLIQAHAKTVSGFVDRGFAEAMKNHAVPDKVSNKASKKTPEAKPQASSIKVAATKESGLLYPAIANYGGVVKLPNATHQPRPGTKLLIDVTSSSDPKECSRAIQQVAKYLNIYGGAGKKPVEVQVAVVFHGGSTLTVLNPDAYASKFKTKGNPNLELLHELHEAGVELYVCGQSLVASGFKTNEVAVFVDPAVSALTAVVNLQADGYAYLPLAK